MITIVWDTETTGLLKPDLADLKEQPQIIELAITKLDDKYKVKKKRSWLINPGIPLPAEITKITGLTDDDLKGKPSFIDVLAEIEEEFLGTYRMVAHNLPFDKGMLVNELRRVNREFAFPYPPAQVCTAQLSEQYDGKRMRLIQLYKLVTGKEYPQTHRAQDDVDALVEIVCKEKYW